VALKTELRNDPKTIATMAAKYGTSPISYDEGYALAQYYKFDGYFEASAATSPQSVEKLHHMVIVLGAVPYPQEKANRKQCSVM